MKRYTIKPRPPVRGLALAAVLSLVGAVVVVLAGHIAVTVVGGVVLAAGLALLALALYSMQAMRVFVDVDDEGFHVHGPHVDKKKAWREVTKVSLSQDETHLVFAHGEVERTHLFCPGGPGDAEFTALLKDITARLDKSRGYRNFI